MLNHIHIKNFAIIEELSLELDTGLTVVTGETGAGKSIMIDAIGLVLGDRADSGMVRHGAKRAEITLTLDLKKNPELSRWLEEHDLEQDDQCFLRRVVSQDGRSRGYINGTPTTLGLLKELGEQLVNIHGQHAHQLLLKPGNQRQLLDAHAGSEPSLSELAKITRKLKQTQKMLEEILSSSDERQAKIDLLTFQVNEMDQLDLKPGELPKLETEHKQLANADSLIAATHSSLLSLYDGDEQNMYQQLTAVTQSLAEAARLDSRFEDAHQMLSSAQIQVQESVDLLRSIGDSIEANPEQLEWVEERLKSINELSRKHHVLPEELTEKHERLLGELTATNSGEEDIESIELKIKDLQEKYRQCASTITHKRKDAAEEMCVLISQAMQGLGMEGGRFEIDLKQTGGNEYKPWGTEEVEFMVAANPGQPSGPLSKVASGGELSRISLAIQLIAASNSQLPTMIFDEVDSGIGGAVAEVVGRQLRQLGEHAQVFCVTHLPQVSAQGHHHLQVQKTKSKDHTETRISRLEGKARVEEIARMLGGTEITERTLEHAREMLDKAHAGSH